MSDSTAAAGYDTITSINFTGGFPSSKDLAPSIVFLVAFVATLPVLVWRLVSPAHRTVILIRPAVFVACRIPMLIIRAIMSKTDYGLGLLIAELVLVGIGYLFLIEPITALWERLVDASSPPPHPRWVRLLGKLLTLTLLVAIATMIASSSMVSGAFDSESMLNTVVALRHASYILSLAVVVLQTLAITRTYFHFGTSNRKTAYLLAPLICLVIVAIYRVAQTYASEPSSPIRSLSAFWIMQITFEFLAYVSYLAISIPAWFPKKPRNEDMELNVEGQQTRLRGVPKPSDA